MEKHGTAFKLWRPPSNTKRIMGRNCSPSWDHGGGLDANITCSEKYCFGVAIMTYYLFQQEIGRMPLVNQPNNKLSIVGNQAIVELSPRSFP
jgi:hypothetical protein